MEAFVNPLLFVPEIIMFKKLLPYSVLSAALVFTSSSVNAQGIGPIQGITDTLTSLSGVGLGGVGMDSVDSLPFSEQQMGDLIGLAKTTTGGTGLHSSPAFNVLPNNPFLIAYSIIIDGPENALVVSDLLQGNLIFKNILSGLPGGGLLSPIYRENVKSSKPDTAADGFINSQL